MTITDHDTIAGVAGDRRPARRVRLRGADRVVPRRAAGRARPLLRDHAGRPRVAAGARRRRRGRRRVPARARDRVRAGAPVLRRRGAAARRATGAGSRSCSTIWEVRNGSRAPELNHPAAIYVETHGGTGIGGSDDHAGVDIGRTWSRDARAPRRRTEFLAHIRAGRVERARRAGLGRQVGARGDGARDPRARAAASATRAPDPAAVLRMVERVMTEGDARSGSIGARPRSRGRPSPAARVARRGRPAA